MCDRVASDDMASKLVITAASLLFLFCGYSQTASEDKCCFKVDEKTKQIEDSDGKMLTEVGSITTIVSVMIEYLCVDIYFLLKCS